MKLYLSSIEIPTPDDLAKLLGISLDKASVAVIPNAQDYYSERPRGYKNRDFELTLNNLGLKVETVDLRNYSNAEILKSKLREFNIVWARGGNTFCLRYEMRRSGFDDIINDLLKAGIVYGGDSAGALVAGISISGIESADVPQFAEEVISEGLKLIPYVVLPHVDNPEFVKAAAAVKSLHKGKNDLIELKDSQAVVFNGGKHWVTETTQK